MASPFAKYAALVFSIAEYPDGVGYSSVQDDFPMELGPDALYDHVSGVRRYIGRDPVTGWPLVVTEYDRYTTTVDTDGVCSASDGIAPPYGVTPDVCSLRIDVSAASVLAGIDNAAKHIVYGVANVQEGADPDDLPPALAPYYVASPMPQAKKLEIRNGMIARGADQQKIDNWFTNHPDATPLDLEAAFGNLVDILTEQLG